MATPQPKGITQPAGFLRRFVTPWRPPLELDPARWRSVVRQVPGAIVARDRLISYIASTTWRISAKDTSRNDELTDEAAYHTEIFERWNDLGFVTGITQLWEDGLDLPAGGTAEVVRYPNERMYNIVNLDGATIVPTGNPQQPVYQQHPNDPRVRVHFSVPNVLRVGISPRPELQRGGWFMPPPEKIYLALTLCYRGDRYYANLLIDTPEAGLLSLGDMSEDSALKWLSSWRELMLGDDVFKVPVLYEVRNIPPQWIPFGRPPTELIFDKATLRYLQLVCAGYGLSIVDIGIGEAQRTMAGQIRSERESRRSGFSTMKQLTENAFTSILPPFLKFEFVERDEEALIQRGRARLANSQAMRHLVESGVLLPEHAQQQLRLDGLLTVDTDGAVGAPQGRRTEAQTHPPDVLETHKPATSGGRGEITKASFEEEEALSEALEAMLDDAFEPVRRVSDSHLHRLLRAQAKGEDLDEAMDNSPKWWQIVLPLSALGLLLRKAFSGGLKASANAIADALYANDLLDSPIVPGIFEVRNSAVVALLEQRAADLVKMVNDGTKFYLKQIISRSVAQGLSMSDIARRIQQGEGLDSILSDAYLLREMVGTARRELGAMSKARITSITQYEINRAFNEAWVEEVRRAGLTQKRWRHMIAPTGARDCPCSICEANEALGLVDIGFLFPTVFEPAVGPPAHPNVCHCGLQFSVEEVIEKANQIEFWHGE